MSQRTKGVDESMIINLQLRVTLNSFSNHDGFKEDQIERAIEEFKDKISKELTNKIVGEYQMQEFLYSIDFVDYEVDSNGL